MSTGSTIEEGGDNGLAEGKRTSEVRWVAGVLVATVLSIFLLYPRIGITDVDAHAYILGAKSIRNGQGYRDLNGAPLNHWPPGYSLILSLAPQPIVAAQVINYLAFGGAVTLLFVLAVRNGWRRSLALAFAAAFGFGFLRILALMAKADILTFFVFLLAAWLYVYKGKRGRLLACLLWSSLIPIKLIAVVFVPGVLAADWRVNGTRNFWSRLPQHLVAGAFWVFFLAGTVAFNYFTIQAWTSPSYLDWSLVGFFNEIKRFADGLFIGFLTVWYGPIRQPEVLVPFLLTLGVGLAAMATLGPSAEGKVLRWIGISVVIMSWVLQLVRLYYADLRLMGYGMLLVLVSFVPRGRFVWAWSVYAFAALALAIYNVTATVSVGTNHAAYEQVARRIASVRLPEGPIVSNSFHILDVHAGIPTRPVQTLERLPRGTVYIEITLPSTTRWRTRFCRDRAWILRGRRLRLWKERGFTAKWRVTRLGSYRRRG